MSDCLTIMGGLKAAWSQRDTRIREMYGLRRLEDKLKTQGYDSAVTNDPKNMIKLAVYLLAALPVRHSIPSLLDKAEQEKNAVCERALESLWREKDQEQRLVGRKPWRWELADLLCMTGWYSVVVDVQAGEKKSPVFIAEIWNPARVYPEWGDTGLAALLYEYELTERGLNARAQRLDWDLTVLPPVSSTPIHNVRLLFKVDNEMVLQSISVDGKLVVTERETKYKAIPVLVGAANGEGLFGGFERADTNWAEHFGESLLESNAAVFGFYNKWMTYHLQLARDAAMGLIKHTGGVRGSVTKEDVKSGRILDMAPGEDVIKMPSQNIPYDLQVILRNFQEQLQRGGFPWTLFGSTGPINLSGFAIEKLLTAAYATIGEQHNTMQELIGQIDMIWLEQFRRKKLKSKSIVSKVPGVIGLIKDTFTIEMVPENPLVIASFQLAAPRDLMERLSAARQAHPEGNILDLVSILEDVIEVNDPTLIDKRLEDEVAASSPEVQQLRLVVGLRRKEKELLTGVNPDPELAGIIKQAWTRILQNLGATGPGKSGQAAPPGLPSNIPPEAVGQSRAAKRAMMGEVPGLPSGAIEGGQLLPGEGAIQ